ncbi:uncharacterized protein LOC105686975 [Athalia rosae]|uniref:uncharacterized protein LOC105686975 n=1 Tax=Athalia rosae TaxID=37344 RepID=UPI0020348074|nr:uncharacterized protein LOC105686975 [Athalia rosae]
MTDVPKNLKNPVTEISMNSLFFSFFCEKWYNGTRRLILRAADLFPRIGIQTFHAKKSTLIRINFRRCFQDWDVPHLMIFLRANRDVVSINLAYNNIHSAGFINLVDYIIAYKHVLELNVQNNDISGPGIEHLCKDGEKLPLKTLRLNGNKFGAECAKKVALFLLKNSHLRYLDVAEVDQTASSLVYFTTVMRWDQDEYNQTLRILDLSRPNTGHMYVLDTAHLANVIGCMLRFNRCLVELHLQKYSFSCHDIEVMLEDMKYNKTLQLLDLSSNNIGDHGMDHIANWLKTGPALTGLLLAHNIITDHGARALSFAMPFSKMKMLDLSHNKLEDIGVMDILNSIKKSTLLRYLRIFGNSMGHCTAKIVDRMLVSGVLVQENIDVKPYAKDHKWNLAYYPSDHYKQRYYNVPRYAFPQPLKIPYVENKMAGKAAPKVNFKYVDPVPLEERRPKVQKNHPFSCICCECRADDVLNSLAPSTTNIIPEVCTCSTCEQTLEANKLGTFQSDVTLVPRPLCSCNQDDCACCYCLPCKGKNEDLPLWERDRHPINCNCCKCGTQEVEYASSSISTKSNELHDYPDGVDQLQKIALILERVDSEMREHIVRWINMNEETLDSDLAMLYADKSEMNEEKQKDRACYYQRRVVPKLTSSEDCKELHRQGQESYDLPECESSSSVFIACHELSCGNDLTN